MSNVETCSQKLYDFCTRVEIDNERGAENLRSDLSDAFAFLRQAESQLISALLKKLNTNPSLELSLDVLLSDAPEFADKMSVSEIEERLEAVFDYIGTNLRVLADGVDNRLYVKVVEQLWAMLLKVRTCDTPSPPLLCFLHIHLSVAEGTFMAPTPNERRLFSTHTNLFLPRSRTFG